MNNKSSNAAGSPHAEAVLQPGELDAFYLFGCFMQWEKEEDPSAGWELLAAARSLHSETSAHARGLLAASRHFNLMVSLDVPPQQESTRKAESDMNTPYGLEITENCADCAHRRKGFFCGFSDEGRDALSMVSHTSVLPAGAILFVEGQAPRGMFIICSGRVNLSTSSREGKVLTLKTVASGETLGLSAAISNVGYETTAETATPCQINFVERKHIAALLESHKEIGMQIAQRLSQDFQAAHRDIRDLVLTRSAAGKLARLLLAQSVSRDDASEARVHASMTHEEMAQRIGASRETVTRLLSHLKRKKLIRSDGSILVIRDRSALQALTV